MNKPYFEENDLANKYKGLVYKICSRFKVKKLDYEDLIQAGFMGLLIASRKYDLNSGVKFTTFACIHITYKVKDELKKIYKRYEFEESISEIIIEKDYFELDKFAFSKEEEKMIMLKLKEKLTQSEIAKKMKISQSTVSRAFAKIKEAICK